MRQEAGDKLGAVVCNRDAEGHELSNRAKILHRTATETVLELSCVWPELSIMSHSPVIKNRFK